MKKVVFIILGIMVLSHPINGRASVQDDIANRNKQIEEIQKQIADYQRQIEETGSKARTLSTEISRLNAVIGKIQLEIAGLNLAINQTDGEIGVTQKSIEETIAEIDIHKGALAHALQELYVIDQQNITELLFTHDHLSDFFSQVKTLDDVQDTLRATIIRMKQARDDLEAKQTNLEEKLSELQELKSLQESQRRTLNQNKSTKDTLLKQTKGEEAKYQTLVKQSQQQIQRIQEQIFYLQQSGLSTEDVIKYGQLAARRVGIRPAFLIAILEVESRLGRNVGTGNWNDDMYQCYLRLAKIYPARAAHYTKRAEDEKAAFFKIINKLGLDPASVKVSKEPSYGCGGAMGPAQFIPTTWLGYESQVAAATGHAVPNPWNIEDAFMAAAIKLSKGGAADGTRAGEIRAAKAYISGNALCTSQICNYYANLALDKAAIIEQNLQ